MARKKVKVEQEAPQPKGMLEKLGIKDAEDLASQIARDFQEADQVKYSWIPERNEDVKNYFGVTAPAEWPFKGASRIKSQFQRIVVDVFAGNVIKSIYLPEKRIKAAATNSQSLENAKYVEDLHNFLADMEYDLHTVLDRALPTALIESFVVLHPVYEYKTNEVIVSVRRMVPADVDADSLTYDLDTDTVTTLDGQPVPSMDLSKNYLDKDADLSSLQEVQFDVTKEECIKDGISVKTINGYRFYMSVSAPGETPYEKIQNAPFVIHECIYSIREFEQYRDSGYFEDVDPHLDNVYDPQRQLITYTKLKQAGFVKDMAQAETPYISVLKWSGKWKINGKWREVVVWKDKNGGAILRVEPNIFGIRPYFPVIPFPIDDTPYGESLCKIIRPLVKELDLLLRTITNIALMKSAPPKFFDPSSGFNPSTIGQFGPNSWIPAREPARNVLVPPSPEDPNVALQMVQLLINFIERITGITEVIQGQVSNRANTTATEVQHALVRSGVRFDQVYERIKDQLKPMFPYIHKLCLRYMPTLKEIQLMGAASQNGTRLTAIHKGQLEGQFNFELAGNSIVTEQNELQNALALYNTLGQHPYLSYKPESIYYVLFNIVKRLNPLAMDQILPTPDEVKTLERDRAQVQGEQEALAAEQANQSGAAQAQMMQMQLQMEAAMAQQKAQEEAQAHELDLRIKEEEFNQKLRQQEELHRAKLEQIKELTNAKAKEAAKAKPKSE